MGLSKTLSATYLSTLSPSNSCRVNPASSLLNGAALPALLVGSTKLGEQTKYPKLFNANLKYGEISGFTKEITQLSKEKNIIRR